MFRVLAFVALPFVISTHVNVLMLHSVSFPSDFVNKSLAKFINGLDSELVYAIFVSPEGKRRGKMCTSHHILYISNTLLSPRRHVISAQRVTVAFRGSVNANDWITNTQGLGAMTDFKVNALGALL